MQYDVIRVFIMDGDGSAGLRVAFVDERVQRDHLSGGGRHALKLSTTTAP